MKLLEDKAVVQMPHHTAADFGDKDTPPHHADDRQSQPPRSRHCWKTDAQCPTSKHKNDQNEVVPSATHSYSRSTSGELSAHPHEYSDLFRRHGPGARGRIMRPQLVLEVRAHARRNNVRKERVSLRGIPKLSKSLLAPITVWNGPISAVWRS